MVLAIAVVRTARSKSIRTTSLLPLLILLTVHVTAMPIGAHTAPAAGPDTVVIGTLAEPRGLNPLFDGLEVSASSAFFDLIPLLFTLDVQRDASGRPFAQGVDALPSVSDGAWRLQGERMTLRWTIRRRSWHDGRPVTCADYVFGHRLARDERVVEVGEVTKRIASVSCPRGADGREVAVVWRDRYAYANLTVIGGPPLPRHLLEPFYRANPSTVQTAPYGNDARFIVGDGAYRLVEWHKGTSLTLEAVPNHAIFGTPRIKRITWRFFRDGDTLASDLQPGVIDLIPVGGQVSIRQAVELERRTHGQVRGYFAESMSWSHIDFNLDNPFLKDLRVRRAIAHGINRTQIVQQLLLGRASIAYSYLPRGHPGYTDQVRRYPHDPARARALLHEAGFSPGPDGIMRDSHGRRLALDISTTAGISVREQMEQIIQENLRQVGIEVTILSFPPRVFFAEALGRRKFTGLALYIWVFDATSDCDLLYTSDGIPSDVNRWSGQNFPGYRSQEMDRACKGIGREIDEATRNGFLNESAQIFSRDLPALPLHFAVYAGAAKVGLRGLTAVGPPSSQTWNAHQWYWESR